MTYRDAVLVLADRLAETEVDWAVTASANLALRGYDVEPADVDVKTDAEGVRTVADVFAEAVVRPVTPPESSTADWIRSHVAVLELAGVRVELVGDAESWDPEAARWVAAPPVADRVEFLSVEGVEVPVMPLEYERRQYQARGDEDRLAVLAADR